MADKLTRKVAYEIFYHVNDSQAIVSSISMILTDAETETFGTPEERIARVVPQIEKLQNELAKARDWAAALEEHNK